MLAGPGRRMEAQEVGGREGTPAQVADLILMLVKNDYITGETMTIDGGLTMRIA